MARKNSNTLKISKVYNINKSQFELDFIDINLSTDTPLFLDSSFISNRNDEWSQNASQTISSFFDHLLSLISNNNLEEAKSIFKNFEEPNETRLGLSAGKSEGKGVGKEKTSAIFNNLLNSKAAITGLLEDLEDCSLFIDKFGPDNLSDMITNIIKLDLIEYTQTQAKLWNIPLIKNVTSGQYWDKVNLKWSESFTEMIVYKNKSIILVPKSIVVRKSLYNPNYYHQHFALSFLKDENLKLSTSLVQTRVNKKKKTETKYVTKSSIKEDSKSSHIVNGYNICSSKGNKENLVDFSSAFPSILKKFKTQVMQEIVKSDCGDLYNTESSKYREIAVTLIERLKNIKKGTSSANEFHDWSIGAFEFLFVGQLSHPRKEERLHNGRKRVDITFANYANKSIFFKLQTLEKFPSNYIFIECKNYTEDPTNPELDQLAGRFSERRGKVGILHCREIKNLKLFIERCKDTFKDDRGIIIPLTDEDLISGLESIGKDNVDSIQDIIEKRVRDIRM